MVINLGIKKVNDIEKMDLPLNIMMDPNFGIKKVYDID